jgi:hypothetical protein
MFYDENQIKKVLNCEKCHKKFDIPFVVNNYFNYFLFLKNLKIINFLKR